MTVFVTPPQVLRGSGSVACAPVQRAAARGALAGGGALAVATRGPWHAGATLGAAGALDAFKVTDRFEVSGWDPQNPNPLSHDMATRPMRGLSWSGPLFGDE